MIKGFTHKITAFILVIMLFANNINTITIIGGFIINQDFIAKTLCIQKEDQQGCNGKCHLRKQLAENDSESNNNRPYQENKRVILDIYCLFASETINSLFRDFTLPQINLIHNSSRIAKTSLDVETPPPIFS